MILDLSDKMGKKLTTRRRTKSQAPQLAPSSPTIHLLLGPGGCKKKKKKNFKSEIEEKKNETQDFRTRRFLAVASE